MAEVDRKARIRAYKETPPPAGVYRVRNTVESRSFIGAAANVAGKLNGQRFQLEMGSHPDRELQQDWHDLGAEAFTFEVLDVLSPSDDPRSDPADELRLLKELWIERLSEVGEALYRQSWRGL